MRLKAMWWRSGGGDWATTCLGRVDRARLPLGVGLVAAVATIVDAVQTAGGGHRGTLGGDAQVRSLWGNCARARGAGARGGERSITHVGSPVAKSHLYLT